MSHNTPQFLFLFPFTFREGEFSCLRFSATSQISLDSPVAQPSWRALWGHGGSYPGDNATMQYLSIAAPQVTEPSSTGAFHPSLGPLPPVSSTDARRSSTVGATILIWIPRAFFRRTGFSKCIQARVHRAVAARRIVRIRMYYAYAKEKCGMCEIRATRVEWEFQRFRWLIETCVSSFLIKDILFFRKIYNSLLMQQI